ncbi:MAG: hypothetical protein KAI39_07050 [Desulfobulbaceae bacterium]|nr:hypothetical protein [Desulfobulbaceae bacterium]
MKTRNIMIATLCAVTLSLGFAFTSFAGIDPGTGIVNSKHDMRAYASANGGTTDQFGRVCAYCHTPHHAVEDINADYMPLWSRSVTAGTFIGYTSSTIEVDGQVGADPVAGPSRLCMGCHDGAVAIDAYYGQPGTATMVEGDAFTEIGVGLGGDLSNDHPIGFDYDQVAFQDNEINAASAAFAGGVIIADVLYDDGLGHNLMTCSTCHDVHNSAGVVDDWFLYGYQQDSNFCITCHDK